METGWAVEVQSDGRLRGAREVEELEWNWLVSDSVFKSPQVVLAAYMVRRKLIILATQKSSIN